MKKIIYLFILWRITLFIIAAIAPLIVPPNFGHSFPYWQERLISSGLPYLLWSFGNFDGVHYLGIAKDAYAAQYTQAFFPVYPLFIKIASYITFGNLIIAGLLISNTAFLAGFILFYKLTSKIYNDKIALWSCIFLLSFPTSFFFGAIYTEGLFFLLIIAFFYLINKKKYWQAAAVGAFASATRLVGLFLSPFVGAGRRQLKFFLLVLIVPLGFLAYVLYLQIKFDNPLYFLSSQSIFGQERLTVGIVLLPQVFFRYFKILLTTSGLSLISAILELSSTIFALVMLVIAIKKVKFEWVGFSFLAVLIPTLTGTLASMPRYILIAFPIYIVLASIKNIMVKLFIVSVFLLLSILLVSLFTQGYWVA